MFNEKTGWGRPPRVLRQFERKEISNELKEGEIEKGPKTRILVLEDEYTQQAQEGLNLPFLETMVISSIEELKKIDPKKFYPDIIISDINVPPKKWGKTGKNGWGNWGDSREKI